MNDILLPMALGLLIALPIVVVIRLRRRRAAALRPPAPEVPVSRQHRRAIERRENKGL